MWSDPTKRLPYWRVGPSCLEVGLLEGGWIMRALTKSLTSFTEGFKQFKLWLGHRSIQGEASLEDAGHSLCSLDVLGTALLLLTLLPGCSLLPWPRNSGAGRSGLKALESWAKINTLAHKDYIFTFIYLFLVFFIAIKCLTYNLVNWFFFNLQKRGWRLEHKWWRCYSNGHLFPALSLTFD